MAGFVWFVCFATKLEGRVSRFKSVASRLFVPVSASFYAARRKAPLPLPSAARADQSKPERLSIGSRIVTVRTRAGGNLGKPEIDRTRGLLVRQTKTPTGEGWRFVSYILGGRGGIEPPTQGFSNRVSNLDCNRGSALIRKTYWVPTQNLENKKPTLIGGLSA